MRRTRNHRLRMLDDFKPMEVGREERAMKMHEETLESWKKQAERLAAKVKRDPSTLVMNSEDEFRRVNEERYLISQVAYALANKDIGVWTPLPHIGDLYAQPERKSTRRFEVVRNPDAVQGAAGSRPTNWFQSKYYKKRAKQLRQWIEKIKPFEPDTDGMVLVGKPLNLSDVQESYRDDESQVNEAEESTQRLTEGEDQFSSVVSLTLDKNRLFFVSELGEVQTKKIQATNDGTTAIYYEWLPAREVELMYGTGVNRKPVCSEKDDDSEHFDWRGSDSFSMPKNMIPKTRSEFYFSQLKGSILPGTTVTFSFAFKSLVPGAFTSRWVMRLTPQAKSTKPLMVELRGVCEAPRPDLERFKSSIDNSLRQSERTRCIDEILSSVLNRVMKITRQDKSLAEDNVDGDLLVDGRAPEFDRVNSRWGLKYSPGLYHSLHSLADDVWDKLGYEGFDRFWDYDIAGLSKLIMTINDGPTKREMLHRLNDIINEHQHTTHYNPSLSLSYSLLYIQLARFFDQFGETFAASAAEHKIELPPFTIPRRAETSEEDEGQDSSRRKSRVKRDRRPAKKSGKRGRDDDNASKTNTSHGSRAASHELPEEFKSNLRELLKEQLRGHLNAFHRLAGESAGVSNQLTRDDHMANLDTNLDSEVDEEEDLE